MARSLMAVTLISHVSPRTSAALHSDQQVSLAVFIVSIVPVSVKKFIAENAKLRAPQLWKEMLKIYPRLNFTQKALYKQQAS
ncbi:hypothetical protein B0H13DRAFT_2367987 [Mycena leptocephala]|nr:hypothetical protein B0H13DRAFT_2367987 [Mycena leptocephala]